MSDVVEKSKSSSFVVSGKPRADGPAELVTGSSSTVSREGRSGPEDPVAIATLFMGGGRASIVVSESKSSGLPGPRFFVAAIVGEGARELSNTPAAGTERLEVLIGFAERYRRDGVAGEAIPALSRSAGLRASTRIKKAISFNKQTGSFVCLSSPKKLPVQRTIEPFSAAGIFAQRREESRRKRTWNCKLEAEARS